MDLSSPDQEIGLRARHSPHLSVSEHARYSALQPFEESLSANAATLPTPQHTTLVSIPNSIPDSDLVVSFVPTDHPSTQLVRHDPRHVFLPQNAASVSSADKDEEPPFDPNSLEELLKKFIQLVTSAYLNKVDSLNKPIDFASGRDLLRTCIEPLINGDQRCIEIYDQIMSSDPGFSHWIESLGGNPSQVDYLTSLTLCVRLYPRALHSFRNLHQQLREIRSGFSFLDRDRDGVISMEELDSWILSFGEVLTRRQLNGVMKMMGEDKSRGINFANFLWFWLCQQKSDSAIFSTGFAEEKGISSFSKVNRQLNKRDTDIFDFSWHDFWLYLGIFFCPMLAFYFDKKAYRSYGKSYLRNPITMIILPIYLFSVFIWVLWMVGDAISDSPAQFLESISITEAMSPIAIYSIWAIASAHMDSYIIHEPIHFLSSATLDGVDGYSNAFKVVEILISRVKEATEDRKRTWRIFSKTVAILFSAPHAAIPFLYRMHEGDDALNFDSWISIIIPISSAILSLGFLFMLLNRIAEVAWELRLRIVRLEHFVALTNILDASQYNLPYVNLQLKANLVAWHKIRTFLLTENPSAILWMRTSALYALLLLFALCITSLLQWFAGYLSIGVYAVIQTYDIIVLGIYSLCMLALAAHLNYMQSKHIDLLFRESWKIELHLELRKYTDREEEQFRSTQNLLTRLASVLRFSDDFHRFTCGGFVIDSSVVKAFILVWVIGFITSVVKFIPRKWDVIDDA
eukprot:TRINITY_DN6740_c0_g1_i3.p1 TRINITY_DN6740_c0_g1~~TRINITY_DN6740_c0_g1_i3.p1  ORF type:complete len:743 (+),score=129.29 TRINITY_DN6740_c0_g1_i3:56-2284(+)